MSRAFLEKVIGPAHSGRRPPHEVTSAVGLLKNRLVEDQSSVRPQGVYSSSARNAEDLRGHLARSTGRLSTLVSRVAMAMISRAGGVELFIVIRREF